MFLSHRITRSELYLKINPAALRGMTAKAERIGAEKLVRKQTHSSKAGAREGLN